jgi:hypothetical protein
VLFDDLGDDPPTVVTGTDVTWWAVTGVWNWSVNSVRIAFAISSLPAIDMARKWSNTWKSLLMPYATLHYRNRIHPIPNCHTTAA